MHRASRRRTVSVACVAPAQQRSQHCYPTPPRQPRLQHVGAASTQRRCGGPQVPQRSWAGLQTQRPRRAAGLRAAVRPAGAAAGTAKAVAAAQAVMGEATVGQAPLLHGTTVRLASDPVQTTVEATWRWVVATANGRIRLPARRPRPAVPGSRTRDLAEPLAEGPTRA